MTDLKVWSERELLKVREDLDRLVDAMFTDYGVEDPRRSGSRVSVAEKGGRLIMRIPLPGVEPEGVEVSLGQQSLVVVGTTVEKIPGGTRTSAFRREIGLPCPVAATDVAAVFADGVLTVDLPTCPARRISISIKTL